MLRLDFSPQPEELPEIAELWVDAFTSAIGRIDEGLDTARINDAFKKARNTLKKWPAPAHVIELMKRRPEVQRISYVPTSSTYGKGYLDVCFKMIDGEITEEEANALWAELDKKYGEPDQEVPF